MRRTRFEGGVWACWLPGSAGGPRLNMPSFSAFSVVSHGRHDLYLCGGPVAHTDSVAASSEVVESALEGVRSRE